MALTSEPLVSDRRGLLARTAAGTPLRETAGGSAKRRAWGQRYASRLLVTDLLSLIWAATGVHLVRLQAVSSTFTQEPIYLPFLAMTLGLVVVWLIALT